MSFIKETEKYIINVEMPYSIMIKADKKKIPMLKLNPFPDTILCTKSSTPIGIETPSASFIMSKEIESLDARAPIKATIGIKDMTKKKARCPGNILISGFLINSIAFFKNPFARSILSTSYFKSSLFAIICRVASFIASSNVFILSRIIL